MGPYVLEAPLGSGGQGTVFRARHLELGRQVALKLLHQREPEAVARFLREGRLLSRLEAAGVPPVHELGQAVTGQPYLAMGWIDGVDLATWIKARGRPDPARAAAIVADLARSLATCHAAGVVHRDLKPENVLLDPEGRPVLIDFGLARPAPDRQTPVGTPDVARLTQTGAIVGTPAFMAPEQLEPHWGEVGPHTDVYGLGGILYFLLTERAPFPGKGVIEIALSVVRAERPDPRRVQPRVPERLAGLTRRCLAREPSQRPRSAAGLADELERWLQPGERRWATVGLKVALLALALGAVSGLALVGADRGRAPVEPAEALVAAVASGSSQRSLEETAGLAGSALSLEPEPAVISGVGGADPLSDEELDLLVQDLFTRPREVLAALAREPVERVLAALGARPECAEYVDHESLRRLHERALGVPPDAQAAFFLTLIEQQAGREWGRLEKGLIFAMATVPDWQGWKKIRLDLALSRDRVDLALPLAPNYSDWKHLPTDLAMLGAETVGRTEQGPFAQGGWQGLVARHPYARVQIVHYELREPKPTGPDELTERWRAKQAEVRARAWAAAERLLAHPQLTARGFGLALETLLDVYRSSEPGEDWRQPERWDELERLAGQARRRFGLADSRIAVARQRLAWLRFQDSPGSSEWAELERSMVAVRQLSRAPRAWLLQLEASLHRLSLLRTRRAAGRGRDLLGFVQLGFRRVEPFASIEQPFGWSRGQVRQLAVLRGWLALHEDRGAELAFEGLRQGAWSHYWQHGGLGRDARSILGPRPAERLKRRLVEARGRPARGR